MAEPAKPTPSEIWAMAGKAERECLFKTGMVRLAPIPTELPIRPANEPPENDRIDLYEFRLIEAWDTDRGRHVRSIICDMDGVRFVVEELDEPDPHPMASFAVYRGDDLVGSMPALPAVSRSSILTIRHTDFRYDVDDKGRRIIRADQSLGNGDLGCLKGFIPRPNIDTRSDCAEFEELLREKGNATAAMEALIDRKLGL